MTENRRAGYTWAPTEEYVANANVTRLARTHGIGSLAELRHRSVADIGWYWGAVVRDLGLPFRTPYTQVVELSAGIEHPDWFTGGELNVVDACLTRWARAAPDRPAVVHEAEDGTTRTLTFGELDDQVARLAAGLRGLGVGRGDAVALYLPMIPEAVVALYAVARLGAVLVPLFSGFAPAAIASRLQDAAAKAVIVADGTIRRRRAVAMKPLLDEALPACPSVRHVVLAGNLDPEPEAASPRDLPWSDLLACRATPVTPNRCAPPTPCCSPTLPALRAGTRRGRPENRGIRTPTSWLARDVFGGRVPVINFSGGTEVGGSFLAPYPVEPIRSCSLGGPSLGMDVDVVDDAGRPVRGAVGELVCRQPWPAMTRSIWQDDARYLETYWSTFAGMWRHGDYALIDADGQWFLRGRSDDVMNVAGKRLAPAEVEAVLAAHPAVAEAAVVGVPDARKGEAVWAFWVPRAGADVADDVRRAAARHGCLRAGQAVRAQRRLPGPPAAEDPLGEDHAAGGARGGHRRRPRRPVRRGEPRRHRRDPRAGAPVSSIPLRRAPLKPGSVSPGPARRSGCAARL